MTTQSRNPLAHQSSTGSAFQNLQQPQQHQSPKSIPCVVTACCLGFGEHQEVKSAPPSMRTQPNPLNLPTMGDILLILLLSKMVLGGIQGFTPDHTPGILLGFCDLDPSAAFDAFWKLVLSLPHCCLGSSFPMLEPLGWLYPKSSLLPTQHILWDHCPLPQCHRP